MSSIRFVIDMFCGKNPEINIELSKWMGCMVLDHLPFSCKRSFAIQFDHNWSILKRRALTQMAKYFSHQTHKPLTNNDYGDDGDDGNNEKKQQMQPFDRAQRNRTTLLHSNYQQPAYSLHHTQKNMSNRDAIATKIRHKIPFAQPPFYEMKNLLWKKKKNKSQKIN